MLKIESIRIEGFKDEKREVVVEFSESNVSVIYGLNGCGKTTLLRILNAIFDQQDNVLLAENIDKITLAYSVDCKKREDIEIFKNIVINSECDIDELDENSIQIGYNWKNFQESELSDSSSILFGVNRGITSNTSISEETFYNYIIRSRFSENFRNRDELHLFCVALSRNINLRRRRPYRVKDIYDFNTSVLSIDNVDMNVIEEILVRRYSLAKSVSANRVQKALFDTLADACNTTTGDEIELKQLGEQLKANKDKLLNVLTQIEKNTLSDKIISILSISKIDDILENCKENVLLTKLIYNMSLELEKEEGLLQSMRVLQDVFNEHIGPDKELVIDDNDIVIRFKKSEKFHRVSELSSGERHLLILLTIFIIEGREKNFLMIDEPEISLNLRWQRRLLPLLSELAPNSQIIVASHSPSIAKANSKYLVEMR